MDRRSFLSAFIAAAVLDPERLLYVPGAKTIFIPPAPSLVFHPKFYSVNIPLTTVNIQVSGAGKVYSMVAGRFVERQLH